MTSIYGKIKDDIEITIRKYLENGLILNPRYNQEKHCKYNKISSNKEETGIKKELSYVNNFLECYNKNEYLFLIFDNSFIQVNYEFIVPEGQRDKVVSKANLSFYPNPGLYSEDIISDIQSMVSEEERDTYYSIVKEYTNDFQYASNYIRLDYDGRESSFTEFLHPRCHIHIGLHNNFRLGISKLPLLSEFMDFVLFVNYIDKWEEIHSKDVDNLNNHLISFVKGKKINQLTEHEILTENEMKHYLVSL